MRNMNLKKALSMVLAMIIMVTAFTALSGVVSFAVNKPAAPYGGQAVGGVAQNGNIYVIYSDGSVRRISQLD